ncbi:uncharacterized protein LOC127833799 isoform X2 [Dreissena polymorpha]|uniref:uncharacterized protein LOC127833799 isoform X2 n=1 Tax=Dreissena polymorpha TaxID=45954 RepID=UPI0022652489|nr:uncharacterized protein LOC127833799 isoform X2 [Dreissena polymorpha]
MNWKLYTLTIIVHVLIVPKVMTSREFVTPGLPACYVSLSKEEAVEGLSTSCNISAAQCSQNGLAYYLYCGADHYCCNQDDGCQACCPNRSSLNKNEVAGIVIGCVILTSIIMVATYVISGKFCKLKSSAMNDG